MAVRLACQTISGAERTAGGKEVAVLKAPGIDTEPRASAVRLDSDLRTGTYDLTVGTTLAIDNAFATVEGWSSADVGYRRRITKQSRERLAVECAQADAPTLLLSFTLHPSFLELRAGLKNTTAAPLRIKKFEPLSWGVVFPGGTWTDVRTLNAPSGAGQTQVTHDTIRSSANNLLLTFKQEGVRRSLVLGALKTADFTKWAHARAGGTAALEGYDPVGRPVAPGETYLPADSFYVDAATANPFEALEKYGRALRAATGAQPNPYDFPTVCAWYAGVWKTPGAQNNPDKSAYKINTTAGLVEEADKMKERGFLNYSRAARWPSPISSRSSSRRNTTTASVSISARRTATGCSTRMWPWAGWITPCRPCRSTCARASRPCAATWTGSWWTTATISG